MDLGGIQEEAKHVPGIHAIVFRNPMRIPNNLPKAIVSKSLYTNNTITYHGFFYYLDIARAQCKAKEVPTLTNIGFNRMGAISSYP
ncbi:MAG: hypothetical protein A4E44_00231 [Methanosaeta sp. PtaB.Bin018]|nr:MAG: hypothetical protein A4E44_00231 [Methanosaeta sp. PtaB.Bin018]